MGHYCRICGRTRTNEKFSGKGHKKHICKDCSRKNNSKKNNSKKNKNTPDKNKIDMDDGIIFLAEEDKFEGICFEEVIGEEVIGEMDQEEYGIDMHDDELPF